MLERKGHWLVKLSAKMVTDTYLIQGYFDALCIIQKFWAEVKPLEKPYGLHIIFVVLVDHRHAIRHMGFFLYVPNFNSRFGLQLNILNSIQTALFRLRGRQRHILLHYRVILRDSDWNLLWKRRHRLECDKLIRLIELPDQKEYDIYLLMHLIFISFLLLVLTFTFL